MNEENYISGKKKHLVNATIALAGLILSVSLAHAMFGGEALSEKISRLDRSYADQTEIINRADEVIEKQFDIKMRAERSLMSIIVDLSTAKALAELEKDEPNIDEVARLNEKAADYAWKVGSQNPGELVGIESGK